MLCLVLGACSSSGDVVDITKFKAPTLGDMFANRTSIRLMEHAATLDLQQFEDPTFYDKMERARQQTTSRIGLLGQIIGGCRIPSRLSHSQPQLPRSTPG